MGAGRRVWPETPPPSCQPTGLETRLWGDGSLHPRMSEVALLWGGPGRVHLPGAPSMQMNVPAIYHNALPPKHHSLLKPRNPKYKHIV